MGRSRTASQAETRERLLDAARTAFSTRRYTDVTLDQIANAAGFTKGAVYSNFDSKTDLLMAVLERRMDTGGADDIHLIETAADDDLPDATGRRAGRTQERDLDSSRIVAAAWAEAVADPTIGARYRDLRRRHQTRLAAAIRKRATAAGIDMRQDPDALATGLIAMSMATMLEALIDPEIDVEAVHATMTDVVLAGVVATGSTGSDPT